MLAGSLTMNAPDCDGYYAPTAYTPDKLNGLREPRDLATYSRNEQHLRKYQLPKGIFCGEILGRLTTNAIFNFEYDEAHTEKAFCDVKIWEEMQWETWKNPRARWVSARKFLLLYSVISVFSYFAVLATNFDEAKADFWLLFIFVIAPVSLYYFARHKARLAKDINNIVFNRRTGMVSIPRGKGEPPFERPFYEFIPYYTTHAVMHGINWHLYLGHRWEEIGALEPSASKDRVTPQVDWEFLQQYMDVSRPLPDVPMLEPVRAHDPVTAEYDRRTGRPPRYWRDMDPEKAEEMHTQSFKRMRRYTVTYPLQGVPRDPDYHQWPAIKEMEPETWWGKDED